MAENPSNVVWHGGHVDGKDRESLLGQTALTIWLTGLSAAGKSTLAFALERSLVAEGRACYVLDGDNVRHGLNKNLGFSHEDSTQREYSSYCRGRPTYERCRSDRNYRIHLPLYL